MKIKTLLIEIHLDKRIVESDLILRHVLVDTIENRSLGEVIEDTRAINTYAFDNPIRFIDPTWMALICSEPISDEIFVGVSAN